MRREWPTDIGPVDLMCRDADDGWVAVEIKRVGTIDAVEQLCRYLERIRLDPALADVARRPRGATLQAAGARARRRPRHPLRGGRPRAAARRARARADALRVTHARLRESVSKARGNRLPRTSHRRTHRASEDSCAARARSLRSCSRPRPQAPQARPHRRLRLHAHQLAGRERRRGVRARRRRHARRRTAPFPTGGLGTGANLGSQGSVISSESGTSCSPSTPAATRSRTSGDARRARVAGRRSRRAASMPISLTLHDHVLYVLNAGGSARTSPASPSSTTSCAARRLDAPARRRQLPARRRFRSRRTARRSSSRRRLEHDRHVRRSTRTASPARRSSTRPSAGTTPFGFDFDKRGNVLDVRSRGLRFVVRRREERLALRDQRRRGDAPGRAVLARHEQGRPLRVHGERRQRNDLRLLGRPRRQPHAARSERRHRQPRRRQPSARRDPSAATASSSTCSSTGRTGRHVPHRRTTAASPRSAPQAACRAGDVGLAAD